MGNAKQSVIKTVTVKYANDKFKNGYTHFHKFYGTDNSARNRPLQRNFNIKQSVKMQCSEWA